jgi:hypothetical protein
MVVLIEVAYDAFLVAKGDWNELVKRDHSFDFSNLC